MNYYYYVQFTVFDQYFRRERIVDTEISIRGMIKGIKPILKLKVSFAKVYNTTPDKISIDIIAYLRRSLW